MKITHILATVLLTAAMPMMAATTEPYQDPSLSPRERAEDLVGRLTLDEKISLMMDASPAIERLGIPEFNWWSEALHGVARAGVATVLPQSIGMAATFDPDAIGEAFDMVSTEARAKFNAFRRTGHIKRYQGLAFWTPNVNIFRDPRWGRGQETYGEDPYLTSVIGERVVRGLQGDDPKYYKTLAGAKHFAVHSGPEWNRHEFDARDIDPRDLRETYLPAFKRLVDADVQQVMCAYNRYEGEPCCSNKKLLVKILRGEWGYDGIVVSDCWAIRDFFSEWAHRTHPGEPEAAADAVASGTDLECGPVYKNLRAAYDQGLIDEATIDRSLTRVLEGRFKLGEITADAGVPWDNLSVDTDVDTPDHRRIALDLSRKSMTLLKNDGILPLDPSAPVKVMVMGPNAADSVMMRGNYNGIPSSSITILDGIRSYLPDAGYRKGCEHVVSAESTSRFDLLDGGLKATYYNDSAPGVVAAEAVYTTPLALSTGGATVFAPGVELTDFSGVYKGTLVPDEDADYIISVSAAKDDLTVLVDGQTVIDRKRGGRNDNKGTYMINGRKGVAHDIELRYGHGDDMATLNFDIRTPIKEEDTPVDADVVIFVGGISPQLEGEEMKVDFPGFRGGDRESIELPKVQRDLIHRLAAEGKKVIMVNCSGSAVALAPEDSVCSAILQAWYPGQDGGKAVADVLFGAYNPAGRLPITFYKSDSQLPDFEDYSMEGRTYRYFRGEPLYPFGHGLSYTTFAYGTPVVSADEMSATDGTVTLTIPVSNTGAMDGDEVVQVYMTTPLDPAGPIRNLRAFKRVNIPAGETAEVEFTLTPADFATYEPAVGRMTTRPGAYTLHIGPSSAITPATAAITLR